MISGINEPPTYRKFEKRVKWGIEGENMIKEMICHICKESDPDKHTVIVYQHTECAEELAECKKAINEMCSSCSANIKQFEKDCTDECPLKEHRTL